MAVVKGTFGTNLKGSLGNVTFRVTKNGNVASQKATSVSNPKTELQMQQRCKMNTIVQAYSIMKSIVDHSWEGIVYGSKSMNYFEKLNLQNMVCKDTNVAFLAKYNKIVAPYNFIMSRGSLGNVDNSFSLNGFNLGSQDPTVGDLIEAYKCKAGDQITFIQVALKTENGGIKTATGVQQNKCVFSKARITIASDATEDMQVFTTTNSFNSNAFSSIEVDGTVSRGENGELLLSAATSIMGGCVILSRKSGSAYLRSNSSLTFVGDTKAFQAVAAVDTYDPTSPYYLNNASATSESISVTRYAISVDPKSSDSDTFTVNYSEASKGTTVVVSPVDGYYVTNVIVTAESGESVEVSVEGGSASFAMPESNVTIDVGVESRTSYSVSLSGTGAGQVVLNKSKAYEGDTVKLTKNAGVTLQSTPTVTDADGAAVTVSTVGSFAASTSAYLTFTMPAKNVTIEATIASSGEVD